MDALWQNCAERQECKGDCTWCNRHPADNPALPRSRGELERRCAELQNDKARLEAQVRTLRERLDVLEGRSQPVELRH